MSKYNMKKMFSTKAFVILWSFLVKKEKKGEKKKKRKEKKKQKNYPNVYCNSTS